MKITIPELVVLVVDDDAIARGFLRQTLNALQCMNVNEVGSAGEVLAACERFQPNIIFLDIELNGVNGLDLIPEILGATSDQFIVMVSAHGTVDNVKGALEKGVRGFIVKPFTSAKILAALNNACEFLNAKQS